ncbi:NADH-ubiquinone oxidoreductase-F iron-sulfur binding region domain-containing protein [Rhodococcus koreensis]
MIAAPIAAHGETRAYRDGAVVGAPALPAAVHPDITPRLVVGESGRRRLTLTEERAQGCYGPLRVDDPIGELSRANLRGRGGAGFPAGRKWATVAATDACVVVANGEEGEPGSAKDRWLLTHRPHAVLDGLLVATDVVAARRAILYLSHPESVLTIRAALHELPRPLADRIDVHVVEHRYVAGEESAVCRSINGGPALPVAKPPRPFESGVDGLPTLVSNIETLTQAAWILRHDAAEYSAIGARHTPGSGLITLTGAVHRAGVYEVPYGRTMREIIDTCAGGPTDPTTHNVLMGGWFDGIADEQVLDHPWCYDALRERGTSLGCGAVHILHPDEDPLDLAAALGAWYVAESAAQCGVCRSGTRAIAGALERLRDRAPETNDVADLRRWSTGLQGRGACAFLDGAANLAGSVADRHSRPHSGAFEKGHAS